jgi:hypothetical protein
MKRNEENSDTHLCQEEECNSVPGPPMTMSAVNLLNQSGLGSVR